MSDTFFNRLQLGIISTVVLTSLLALSQLVSAKEEAVLTFNPEMQKIEFKFKQPKVDLDKLSYAVAVMETSNFTDGTGRKRLNGHGLMKFWVDSEGVRHREPMTFKSKAESHATFKRVWSNPKSYYKGQLPDLRLATTWVCGPKHPTGEPCGHNGVDDPNNWLKVVLDTYNKAL